MKDKIQKTQSLLEKISTLHETTEDLDKVVKDLLYNDFPVRIQIHIPFSGKDKKTRADNEVQEALEAILPDEIVGQLFNKRQNVKKQEYEKIFDMQFTDQIALDLLVYLRKHLETKLVKLSKEL